MLPFSKPQDDLVHRRQVWEAMSELFLDRDKTDNDIKAIVVVLEASPYNLDQLDFIFHAEVFPALYHNLVMVAGEWGGFDSQWLETRILDCSSEKYPNRFVLWLRRFFLKGVFREWKNIYLQIQRNRRHSQNPW